MANVLKFLTLFSFLFSNKMLVFRAGNHKMLVRIANRKDPDQTAVCLGLFSRQLVFEILEHLPYKIFHELVGGFEPNLHVYNKT